MPDFSTNPRHPRLGMTELALLAGAALAVAAAAHTAQRASRAQRDAQAAVAALDSEIERTRRQVRVLEVQRGGPADVLASQVLLTADAPPSLVLSELELLMPPDVRLAGIGLRYGERLELNLTLRARADSAYDALLTRLADSPRFDSLTPTREDRGDELTAQLEITFRATPGQP